MAKAKKTYVCRECGAEHVKWQGQCSECKGWNTIEEFSLGPSTKGSSKNWGGSESALFRFKDIDNNVSTFCRKTEIQELDKVLGGGIYEGSVTLLGGEPGAGKSTLLSQVCGHISSLFKHDQKIPVERENVLYVSGEETEGQISKRNRRLGVNEDNFFGMTETNVHRIIAKIEMFKPALVIIDSIQLLYDENLSSNTGSVSQIRECTAQLTRVAKQSKIPMILICHVTKSGDFNGPKILEHMVDATIMIEGEGQYRFIRADKNRYGNANEIGIFEMTEKGLISVDNPTALFIDKTADNLPGSSIFMMNHQGRNLLIDVQALAFENEGNFAKRVAEGIENSKITILSALISRAVSSSIIKQDIYVKVSGGLKVSDSGVDLPIALAILSASVYRPIPPDHIAFGEIGLTGNIKNVKQSESRIREAAKLGYKTILVGKNCPEIDIKGVNIIRFAHISDVAEYVFSLKDYK